MVAGGDEYPGLHLSQRPGKLLPGLPEGAGTVEQVSGQQRQLDALPIHIVRQTEQRLPALPPAGSRLPGGQGAEGAVQMEISGVDKSEHGNSPCCII